MIQYVAGGLTAASIYTGYQANKYEQRAAKVGRKIEKIKTAAAKRQLVRNNLAAGEAAVSAGAGTGTLQSSRVQMAQASSVTQTGQALQMTDQLQALGDQASKYLQNAAQMRMYSSVFGGVASNLPA